MKLFRVELVNNFNRITERIAGTKNDIKMSREFNSAVQDVNAPTLVIPGSEDEHVPFEKHGKVLLEKIPRALGCIAQGGQHVTIFTHREQVTEAVDSFLSS